MSEIKKETKECQKCQHTQKNMDCSCSCHFVKEKPLPVWEKELEEYGELHSKSCYVYQEDECSCDMRGMKPFISNLLSAQRQEGKAFWEGKMQERAKKFKEKYPVKIINNHHYIRARYLDEFLEAEITKARQEASRGDYGRISYQRGRDETLEEVVEYLKKEVQSYRSLPSLGATSGRDYDRNTGRLLALTEAIEKMKKLKR